MLARRPGGSVTTLALAVLCLAAATLPTATDAVPLHRASAALRGRALAATDADADADTRVATQKHPWEDDADAKWEPKDGFQALIDEWYAVHRAHLTLMCDAAADKRDKAQVRLDAATAKHTAAVAAAAGGGGGGGGAVGSKRKATDDPVAKAKRVVDEQTRLVGNHEAARTHNEDECKRLAAGTLAYPVAGDVTIDRATDALQRVTHVSFPPRPGSPTGNTVASLFRALSAKAKAQGDALAAKAAGGVALSALETAHLARAQFVSPGGATEAGHLCGSVICGDGTDESAPWVNANPLNFFPQTADSNHGRWQRMEKAVQALLKVPACKAAGHMRVDLTLVYDRPALALNGADVTAVDYWPTADERNTYAVALSPECWTALCGLAAPAVGMKVPMLLHLAHGDGSTTAKRLWGNNDKRLADDEALVLAAPDRAAFCAKLDTERVARADLPLLRARAAALHARCAALRPTALAAYTELHAKVSTAPAAAYTSAAAQATGAANAAAVKSALDAFDAACVKVGASHAAIGGLPAPTLGGPFVCTALTPMRAPLEAAKAEHAAAYATFTAAYAAARALFKAPADFKSDAAAYGAAIPPPMPSPPRRSRSLAALKRVLKEVNRDRRAATA